MSGKGELVNYTRLFKQGPLTESDKAELKQKIADIIDGASYSITIEAMVEVPLNSVITKIIKETTDEIERKKQR